MVSTMSDQVCIGDRSVSMLDDIGLGEFALVLVGHAANGRRGHRGIHAKNTFQLGGIGDAQAVMHECDHV